MEPRSMVLVLLFAVLLSDLYPTDASFQYLRRRNRLKSGRGSPPTTASVTKSEAFEMFLSNTTAQERLAELEISATRNSTEDEKCPCGQETCKAETFLVDEGTDFGDVCYVLYPKDGFKITQCTQRTYGKSCSEALTCGCGGACHDFEFEESIYAMCIRGFEVEYKDFVVTVSKKCCCAS